MGEIIFEYSPEALKDLNTWKKQHAAKQLEIIKIIQEEIVATWPETQGNYSSEDLKYELSGCVSRKIDTKNRFVYRINIEASSVYVLQCKGHYTDR